MGTFLWVGDGPEAQDQRTYSYLQGKHILQ